MTKNDEYSCAQKNAEDFIAEIDEINKYIGAKIESTTINTAFSQEQTIHEQLMASIVEQIEKETKA